MQEKFFVAGDSLAAVNVITFALFAYDKTHNKWRIQGSALLFWTAIGGALFKRRQNL